MLRWDLATYPRLALNLGSFFTSLMITLNSESLSLPLTPSTCAHVCLCVSGRRYTSAMTYTEVRRQAPESALPALFETGPLLIPILTCQVSFQGFPHSPHRSPGLHKLSRYLWLLCGSGDLNSGSHTYMMNILSAELYPLTYWSWHDGPRRRQSRQNIEKTQPPGTLRVSGLSSLNFSPKYLFMNPPKINYIP